MTTERTSGNAEGVADSRVSGTYRDIATERAPASLNERVLRASRAQAGSGYSYWMSWLRPMAWAATVGLCLAIVVQLTDIPEPGLSSVGLPRAPETFSDDAPVEADGIERDQVGRADPVDETRENRPAEKKESADLLAQDTMPASVAAPQRIDPANTVGRASGKLEEETSSPADSDAYQVTDAPILTEAAEMARLRDGPRQEPADVRATALRSLANRTVTAASIDAGKCDESARATPESWLDCIVEIETRGADSADERERLAEAFPDFELPCARRTVPAGRDGC